MIFSDFLLHILSKYDIIKKIDGISHFWENKIIGGKSMKYGYFDLKNKEYVITNPDTPEPWVNYLGSLEYGAIISNNAAGYSFVKSGANGRILRYRFNSQAALPGRYIYIKDRSSGEYWSGTWQPVGKDLKKYESICRHGTGYTSISSKYNGIESITDYYVPLNKDYEIWRCRVSNKSDSSRKLSIYGFCEFTSDSNYEQDNVNLQYTLFISRTEFIKNRIIQNLNEYEDKQADGSNHKERFFGLAGNQKADHYCGSLKKFLGTYRTYSNPIGIENENLGDYTNYNGNSCGAIQSDIELAPNETKEFIFILGQKNAAESEKIMDEYKSGEKCDAEISELKNYWHSQLENFEVETPSDEFNNMINVWNAYQCFITFIWSRAASFIYCGLRNGYGYRDTVQDIQGIIHLDPELALEKIRFMLSAQVSNGAGLPLVKFNHNAGHENTPDDPEYVKETGHPSYRADDALWLFPTIMKYIGESGNKAFLDEKIVYANGGEASVYDHMKKAIEFSANHMGAHGMPAGLWADWNDCLRLGAKGESVFVAFQLYMAIEIMEKLAAERNDNEYLEYLKGFKSSLGSALEKCYDGDRFIRGIRDNGIIVGKHDDREASMWLNPQSWSVISGFSDKSRGETVMQSVYDKLNTPYGAKIMTPSYKYDYFDGTLMIVYNPGTKENGGIFSQTQGWLILAESILGHGDRAFEYFMETCPAAMNDKAEIRQMEPYVHGQFTESDESENPGTSHVHWLTGTASTVMVGCVEGICGMQPDADGIKINPCVPHTWKNFKIKKNFRGKKLNISFENPNGKQSGVSNIVLNGKEIDGNYIPAKLLEETNEIKAVM